MRGEHDRWIGEPASASAPRSLEFTRNSLTAEQRGRLAQLPPHFMPSEDILAVHGSLGDDTECLLEENLGGRLALAGPDVLAARLNRSSVGVILCGHSHMQHMAQGPDGCIIVNPGSVGGPRGAGGLELGAETGSPHARFAVLTWRSDGLTVEMIALEYDWVTVSKRAVENARND